MRYNPLRRSVVRGFALAIIAACATSCTPIIAAYSLSAYTNATKLKAETLATIDLAVDPYPKHAEEVRDLQTRLDAAYEFSRGTPYNREATEMWRIIRNPAPENTLLGSFFQAWRDRATNGKPAGVNPKYIKGKKANVIVAFDRLICLEANKKEATKCPSLPSSIGEPAADDRGSTREVTDG